MATALTIGDRVLRAPAGGRAVTSVTVRNDGDADADVTVEVQGAAAAFASVDPSRLSIPARAAATAAIAFEVPSAGGGDGPLAFSVVARAAHSDGGVEVSGDDGAAAVAGLLELERDEGPAPADGPSPAHDADGLAAGWAAPAAGAGAGSPSAFPAGDRPDADPAPLRSEGPGPAAAVGDGAVDLRVEPPVARGSGPVEYRVVVANASADPAEIHLRAEATDLDVSVQPMVLELPAGASAEATATARPDRFLRGPDRVRTFAVVAGTDGVDRAAASVALVQHGRLPRGAPRVLGAALVGVLVLLLLWATVGRSQVRSVAREVLREDAAEQRARTGRAGPGRPLAGRLPLAASGEVLFTVPARSTLEVTDIVLQNPAGSTGVLRVRRDDDVLLEVALENFRDLDYHFVTPVAFGPGQRLILEAQCTSPATGGGPGCTPSALFSAMIYEDR